MRTHRILTPCSLLPAPRPPRRGILLLVVLGMLILFLMVGTSFIISSNQWRQAQKSMAAAAAPETAKNPLQQQALVDEVLNQVVRDTTNQYSSLRYHSLLRDLYGEDGIAFELTNPAVLYAPNTGDQFITVRLRFDPALPVGSPRRPDLRPLNGYYNGLVWTVVSRGASKESVRIVNYRYDGSGATPVYEFDLLRPERFTGDPIAFAPTDGKVVINGRPFNGTGVGYDPNAPMNGPRLIGTEYVHLLDNSDPNLPVALMPNSSMFVPERLAFIDPNAYFFQPGERILPTETRLDLLTLRGMVGLGGADESYDAVDFQNMALAMTPVSPSETHPLMRGNPGDWPGTQTDWPNPLPLELGNIVLPSFHRPDLIHYWANQAALQTEPSLLRKVMIRPSWFDHPRFTGSNPELAGLVDAFRAQWEVPNPNPTNYGPPSQRLLARMIYGPWDVDNDNDGRRDSVWVDFGAPVMMGPQGKLVKPLAAVLCVDLDGRLNLNAHGTLMQAGIEPDTDDDLNIELPLAGAGNESDDLPRGSGYGPAEISLARFFDDLNQEYIFERLFTGVNGGQLRYPPGDDPLNQVFNRTWAGRYGFDNAPDPNDRGPGVFDAFAGVGYDLMAQLKQQGMPQWANSSATIAQRLGNYATPPDLKGRYGVGLNALGQPVYEAAHANEIVNLDQDSPYELNLSRVGPVSAGDNAVDGPFSLAEYERILRAFDPDASKLPSRLWELANGFVDGGTSTPNVAKLNTWRTLLTTDSFDLPVPAVTLPEWMRLGDGIPGGDPNSTTANDFANVMGKTVDGVHVRREPTNLSFADLLEYRVRIELSRRPPPAGGMAPKHVPLADVQAVMSQLLAPELADGLKIDINRPLGNGRDDNVVGEPGYGVVDEPGEIETTSGQEAPYWRIDGTRANVPASANAFVDPVTGAYRDNVDRDGDGFIEAWEAGYTETVGGQSPQQRYEAQVALTFMEQVNLHNFRRQWLARHLYVLAQTLVDPLPIPAGGPTDSQYIEHSQKRARQLAQWAINAVDFRDPDNICTAFEYDENPFDGWGAVDSIGNFRSIDGDVGDPNDIYGADKQYGGTGPNADVGGVVWGLERPELLMTETMAWHDRRTIDLSSPTEVSNIVAGDPQPAALVDESEPYPDSDFDQLYRPRGALFVELYNPWPAETAANADTHLVDQTTGEDLGVDITKVAVDPTDATKISPVWRIAVFQGPTNSGEEAGASVAVANWDPDSLEAEERPAGGLDRSFYFAQFDDEGGNATPQLNQKLLSLRTMDPDDGTEFFCGVDATFQASALGLAVRPGRYMVVGGGRETAPGKFVTEISNKKSGKQRRIELDMSNTWNQPTPGPAMNADQVTPFRFVEPTPTLPTSARAGYGVASGDPVSNVMVINRAVSSNGTQSLKRNMNITEPARGYPGDDPSIPNDGLSFYQPDPNKEGTYGSVIQEAAWDTPLDDARADGETRLNLALRAENWNHLIPCYSVLYLQRLANPLLPFDRNRNPYVTIDSMSANVTVFNGVEEEEERFDGEMKTYSNDYGRNFFASLQRGHAGSTVAKASYKSDIFSFEPPSDPPSGIFMDNEPGPNERFGIARVPRNTRMNIPTDGYDHIFNAVPDFTLGAVNRPLRKATVDNGLDPNQPFPWLTWNNRPFVSGNEAMLVPRSRSSQLLRAFSGTVNTASPYKKSSLPNSLPPHMRQKMQGEFGHLPNAFLTLDATNPTPDPNSFPPSFARVFEYIGVQSPYVGTETWLNPSWFGMNDPNSVTDARYLRQPPFNRISSYRDPGRVNINTIGPEAQGGVGGKEVWDALFHGSAKRDDSVPEGVFPGPDDDDFTLTRRGYQGGDEHSLLNVSAPSIFSDPFRSHDAHNLVPVVVDPNTTNPSLMRGFFGTGKPFTSVATEAPYRAATRNAYFRYQASTRLGSMATTRSNVYAVWVTIGFFEVEEAPSREQFGRNNGFGGQTPESDALYDRVYPEGYQLGQEMGSDTGDFQRLRGFEIVDRTIPVAFEPGEDHNVERAVRVRRRIE